ncbi:MAG: tetratricopeptide repeat protein, partial [Kofleriaceae bacterium]
ALRRGLETGEVMEDEVARRRESIPPPSVSRVMQKMGMATPADQPREHMPQRELPPLPPAPTQAEPLVGAGLIGASRALPGDGAGLIERKRTGTPEIGVPVVPVVPVQPAVAGVVEKKYDVTDKIERPLKAPLVGDGTAAGRAKRASSQGNLGESSSNWYEEGERAASATDDDFDDREVKKQRAKKLISPSVTDMSMYDTPARNRRGLVLFALLGVGVIGGGLAFALTRGGDEVKPAPLAPAPVAVITSDAAPSQVIDTAGDAGVAVAPGDAAAAVVAIAPSHPVVTQHPAIQRPTTTVATTTGSHDHDRKGGPTDFDLGVSDNSRRHDTTTTTATTGTPPKDTTTTTGGNVTGGPQDPYGTGGTEPATNDPGASPDKKAEFYAGLGQQQLASSDTAGAAASFKKALELDGKNVAAVSGMGEIALRQGLFGDAIAHLKKAARLAPKSSNVYTLLGEAYLNSGQSSVAAENFKKALQLDPDNKRAREGYDDASSKVPPPTDD